MSEARIFQPARSTMQSGNVRTRKWVLEFDPEEAKTPDPVMGWPGSGDTMGQLKMVFDSKDAAVAYAERNGLSYSVDEPCQRAVKMRAYADRFAHNRVR